MRNKNIKQNKLSEITGIPKSSLNQLVTGHNMRTKEERIDKISKALDVSSAWLKGEIDIDKRNITGNELGEYKEKVPLEWLEGETHVGKKIINGSEALEIRKSNNIDVTDEEIISSELKFIKYQQCLEIIKMLKEEDINTDISCLVKHFKEIMTIDEEDYNLLIMYNKLNDSGKRKCDQYVSDMGKIIDYTKEEWQKDDESKNDERG